MTLAGNCPARLERGEVGPQSHRPSLCQIEESPSEIDRVIRESKGVLLVFRPGIRLRHAPQEIAARLRERGEERWYRPLATERASPLLLLPCRGASGVRVG
jgi:hypothetical protein